jgi:hypothetical protein
MAVAVGEIAGAIGLQLWFDALPYDERPIPVLARTPWVLVGLAGFAFAFACWRVWQRRAELRNAGARVKTSLLLALHLLLTATGAIGVMVTDPDFLFGSTLDDSLDLPDGRTAYLYRGGLFCSYEIFVAAPDDLFSFRTRSLTRHSCLEPGYLALEGERVVIVDEHGATLPDQGIDWDALLRRSAAPR